MTMKLINGIILISLCGARAEKVGSDLDRNVKPADRDGRFLQWLGIWTKNTGLYNSGFRFNFGLGSPAYNPCK